MAARPPRGKYPLPQHRPLARPEDRERPFANARRGDPRLGPAARCLSRGARGGRSTAQQPARAAADAVAAREAALRRLYRTSEAYAEARWSFAETRRELIDCLLHLRVLSLEVVECVERWRATGNRVTATWPDPTTGENYVLKMKSDTVWLADSPLGDVLQFSQKSDPFFVVPSAREQPVLTHSNMMTPTLKAKNQHAGGEPKKAMLPLQGSLLRRIREAELSILKESLQARIQQQASGLVPPVITPKSAAAASAASAAAAPGKEIPAWELAALAPKPPVQPPFADGLISAAAAADIAEEVLSGRAQEKAAQKTSAVIGPRAERPFPQVPERPFKLWPVSATKASIQEEFERHLTKVSKAVSDSFETWKELAAGLQDDGPGALEWYWLRPAAEGPDTEPAGLVVFRIKKMSTSFGQLLHISMLDEEMLADALESVKTYMLATLPVQSIRVTLWYVDAGEGLKVNPHVNDVFKGRGFRWFQLCNMSGRRGQVMQCKRQPAPDDPEQPQELPSIEVCLGQAWMRGGAKTSPQLRRRGDCALSLTLGAVCVQQLYNRSDTAKEEAAAAAALAASAANARKNACEGLVKALLSGEFDRFLSKCKPVSLEVESSDQADGQQQGAGNNIAVVDRVAKALGSQAPRVPGIMCQCSDDASSLVRQGLSMEGYAMAAVGLGAETLPEMLEAMRPQDSSFGRLFVTLDWASCIPAADSSSFEVAVHAVGSCSNYKHPVIYLATSEDDTFIVIIPCDKMAPKEDLVFATCADILKRTEPLGDAPYKAVSLPSLSARQSMRIVDIADPSAFRLGDASLSVAEFGALAMSAGRTMPGRLRGAASEESGKVFKVQRPFMLAVFHTEIEELNVPLVATLIP
eukprot:TRINITY_DN111111_c0_g1_i1.p1 TRINITY_DN111111_c0_g1~~TRINITY_DN111111_c0_g1_i1.p1  ORF type:complete len:866 (-),score=190.63 TRINITY_DN111111_c0_g1_i1:125-2722(-)